MSFMLRIFLLSLALLPAITSAETPSDSVYLLETPLTTQDGKAAHLDLYRGQPVLISMFYASCPHVCPTLIAAMRGMEQKLSANQRKQLRVLLVSVDPERDSPESLTELADRHGVDLQRWRFARTPKPEVRKLAAVLGIQYRQLPDGEFNHSTIITLLDRDGRILARTASVTRPDEGFLQMLLQATTPK